MHTNHRTSAWTWCAIVAICLSVTVPASARGKRDGRRFMPTIAAAPIVLDNVTGRTIRGLRITADLAIDLEGCSDITIIACNVRSIRLTDCDNIRIVNSYIHDSRRVGVDIDNCSNVLVQGNRIEDVSSGVYGLSSQGVRVVGNFIQNVRGPMPRGQAVQFDKVTGSGNAIVHNYIRNLHGRSSVEDAISLYRSYGTPDAPIVVAGNYISGDPQRGSDGMSRSGSGIMLGDGGGAYHHCYDNILINPGQVGIGVSGGQAIAVEFNAILSQPSDVSNVGLYVWNQADDLGGDVVVAGNVVNWRNRQGAPNPFWNGGGFDPLTLEQNLWHAPDLPSQWPKPPSNAPWPPQPYGRRPAFPWK